MKSEKRTVYTTKHETRGTEAPAGEINRAGKTCKNIRISKEAECKDRGEKMIKTVNEEEAMIVVKLLIQNGYTVRVYQTDDTIVETIIEYRKGDWGVNPYQE